VSKEGHEAAADFYEALETGDLEKAKTAQSEFLALAAKESFGNEYLAFVWFCDYLMAPAGKREGLLRDPLTRAYFDYLGSEDFKTLKLYLRSGFGVQADGAPQEEKTRPEPVKGLRVLFGLTPDRITTETQPKKENATKDLPPVPEPIPGVTQEDVAFWRDFILFNNPLRPVWERTDALMSALRIRPGEEIADIGCGPGFFAVQFSKLSGPDGKIYAIDTNKRHLDFLEGFTKEEEIKNIELVHSKFDDVSIPENSVDRAFMCSLYGVIYLVSTEPVKDRFVISIIRCLKPGGKLAIVDNNAVVPPGVVPYHGSRIEPSLVIAQLEHYGFRLLSQKQIIPQRYVLEFDYPGKQRE
jgi:ubiquinone/menaquinone biosynthesis C-methylase UbiE